MPKCVVEKLVQGNITAACIEKSILPKQGVKPKDFVQRKSCCKPWEIVSPANILLGSAAFSNDKYDIFSGCVFYNNILLILNYILGILRKSRETAKEESIFGGDFYNAPSAYPNTYMYILLSNMTSLASYLCFTRALLFKNNYRSLYNYNSNICWQ